MSSPPEHELGTSPTTGSKQQQVKEKEKAKALGDYIILTKRKIGSGSFADVYRGYHKSTKQPVAIKVISKDKIDGNQKLKESLEFEVSVLKRRELDHSHIIKLLAVHKSQNHYYLVMEFCSGGDLTKYMQDVTQGPLPEPLAKRFMQHIARGLKCLHNIHVLHRDLKPQNLLLTQDEKGEMVVKIADFGFARDLRPNSLAATFCGSPLYMAPEVLKGEKYSDKADLWSAGAILYEMLTGRPPYTANSIYSLIKVIQEKPELSFPSHISSTAVSFVQGLLQREPSLRFSFDEFLNHAFLQDAPAAPVTSASISSVSNSVNSSAPIPIDMGGRSLQRTNSGGVTGSSPSGNSPPKVGSVGNGTGIPRQTKISPFRDEVIAQPSPPQPNIEQSFVMIDPNQDQLQEVKNVPKGNPYIVSSVITSPLNYSLSKMVTIASSGTVIYPSVIFDFTNLKYDRGNEHMVNIINEVEAKAKRAWVIAECAYLNDKYSQSAEALALYIKALQLLQSTFRQIKQEFSDSAEAKRLSPVSPTAPLGTSPSQNGQLAQLLQQGLTGIQANNLPERLSAVLLWIRARFVDFLERAEKTNTKLKNSLMDSSYMASKISVDSILYRYAFKLARHSAKDEHLSDCDLSSCIAMYTRSKLVLEYLLYDCDKIANSEDKQVLAHYVEQFTKHIDLLSNDMHKRKSAKST